ncbi:MAG: hypothetical protein QM762_26370 [Chryseolinea sp.]
MDKETTSPTPRPNDGLIRRMANYARQRIARTLDTTFGALSQKRQKTLLICLGVAVTLPSGNLIVRPFLKSASALSGILPTPIQLPQIHDLPQEAFSEADYLTLIGFKRTLDSLSKYDPQGYRRMTQGHEGLLDSIDYLVDIFRQIRK